MDVAFLAGQTPPIKILPTQNTSHLPYNEQVSMLEADYLKYYSYRGDLKYNEKMARSIKKEGKGKCTEEETCMYRVCRDKNRFFETRIKDDVLILGKILESMIERTSEMEGYFDRVLFESGEKEMPNWDDLFSDGIANTHKVIVDDAEKIASNNSKGTKSVGGAKRKKRDDKSVQQKSQPKRRKLHIHSKPPTLTHNQAQMLVAQMMLARRSIGQINRVQFPDDYIKEEDQKSSQENSPKNE